MDSLKNNIEAILFYKAEPVSRDELRRITKAEKEDIEEAINVIKNSWNGGISVVDNGDTLFLMTSSDTSPLIETLRKEELEKELGKASLETLTIVLYKGPISRREIDFIRGVQSQYILRTLVSRGLIERVERGGEGYVYRATHELLGNLGIKETKDLPEYGTLVAELETRLEGLVKETDESR